jgi:hypothetical protein
VTPRVLPPSRRAEEVFGWGRHAVHCWGVLEQHWNGTLLTSIASALQSARTMTRPGKRSTRSDPKGRRPGRLPFGRFEIVWMSATSSLSVASIAARSVTFCRHHAFEKATVAHPSIPAGPSSLTIVRTGRGSRRAGCTRGDSMSIVTTTISPAAPIDEGRTSSGPMVSVVIPVG